MRNHTYYVYILTNKYRSTLYVGVTNDLGRRVAEHKLGEVPGLTRRYQFRHLVWFEHFRHISQAIAKEKQLKSWLLSKKNALIEKNNPRWFDMSADWDQQPRIDHGWASAEEMVNA